MTRRFKTPLQIAMQFKRITNELDYRISRASGWCDIHGFHTAGDAEWESLITRCENFADLYRAKIQDYLEFMTPFAPEMLDRISVWIPEIDYSIPDADFKRGYEKSTGTGKSYIISKSYSLRELAKEYGN